MTDKEMIAAARLIARLAHRGQVDKAGDDYFAHPEAVAAMLDEPEAKVVGYLHDTVECFLQVFFGKSCRHFWRMLHLQIGEMCISME